MAPPIRTDIVDVYVFRTPPATPATPATPITPATLPAPPNPNLEVRNPRSEIHFLQLHRVPTISLPNTWQPIMGHMHEHETAAQTALRELAEETGYAPGAGLVSFWQLEEPNTYFLHSHQCIIMSPCFAAHVAGDIEPTLDADHDAVRWVPRPYADRAFLWPGQRTAVAAIVRDILDPTSPVEPLLRIDPATV
ncbi:MAG: NUDIX domain-containing protein [Phycisphaeraceae bacterium]